MRQYINNSRLQRWFILGMCLLFVLFAVLLCYKNVGGQTQVFFRSGRDYMADALNTEGYARALNPYGYSETEVHEPFADANYPPLAYLLFFVLNQLSLDAPFTTQGMIFASIFMTLSFLGLYAACQLISLRPLTAGVCLAMFLSGTALFSFERGNIIALAAALCTLFLAGYSSENRVFRELAFVALALAAALKIFPALFGLLLIAERRWKEALRLVLYGLVAAFLPFLFMEGGFANLPLLLENFGAHKAFYQRRTYPRYGFRLFSSLSYDLYWANPFLENNLWKLGEKMLLLLPWVDVAFTALCLVFALLDKELWKKALAIALILINYPVNSGAYTALYLFPVIVLYLNCDTLTKRDIWYLAAFFVILSPVQIPIPYGLLGITNEVIVNLTDMLRALVAYVLFFALAILGAKAGAGFLRQRGHSRDSRPSVTSV